MIVLEPDVLTLGQQDKTSFEQNTSSSGRRGHEGRQQSSNLAYGRESLRISSPIAGASHSRGLPELGHALRTLHEGRLKAEITNSCTGTALARNSNLIATRVLHFTSKQ